MRPDKLLLFAGTVVIAACNRDVSAPQTASAPSGAARFSAAPDNDATMADLSSVARHLAGALRDSATRADVARAMKDPKESFVGIDLHSCAANPLVLRLLLQGERAGGSPSQIVCQGILHREGLVLYMDRDRLRAWDGSTIPIVTAIAQPGSGLPVTFHGYRSPTKIIDLPSDGSLGGPILVVLPYVHPASAIALRANTPSTSISHATQAPGLIAPPRLSNPDRP